MSDELTTLLDRTTPNVVDELDYDQLARRGRRRRWAKRSVAGLTAATGLVLVAGLVSSLPTTQPRIEPLTPAAPEASAPTATTPSVVTATDGAVPVLPADAAPVALDARSLPGLGTDVRVAAVASDGRVAVSATGRDLAVAHPDAADAAVLQVPDTVERCESIAFDTAGDLWALCHDANENDPIRGTAPPRPDSNETETFQASLLRYEPDSAEPTTFDVTGLIRKASPTAGNAKLWIEDGQIRAVVPTDPPASEDNPNSWGNAAGVTLFDDDLQTSTGATVWDLPSLRIDPGPAVAATAGIRFTHQGDGDGAELIDISWLTHETSVKINTPDGDGDAHTTTFADAYLGHTMALTYRLSGAGQATTYGITADGHGTTSLMRLPSSSTATRLVPAPNGSVHVLAPQGASLTIAEALPATSA